MKPLLSRRRFCASATLFPLLVAAAPGRAHDAPPLPNTGPEPDAQMLYATATRMLREGRTFEKAAVQLEKACQREPKNVDYALALGCAYASRAASLAWAGAFGERLPLEMAAYREVVALLAEKEIEMRQKIKEGKANEDEIKKFEQGLAAYKENLKPPLVQVILIKDDKAPYKLTRPELVAQLTELNQKALSAWEKGIALAKTPDEKANAQYVCGGGMWLLQIYLSDESHWRFYLTGKATKFSQFRYYKAEPLPLEIKGVPNDAQIKAALKGASEGAPEAAPETALYKQAQADFLASKEQANPGVEVTELYREAALLEPKNTNLWNRVYDRETAYRYGEKQADAPSALDDLHHAQARDKSNAWYGYEEAGRILAAGFWSNSDYLGSNATEKEKKVAHDAPRTDAGYAAGKRAAALIERTNTSGRFAPPVYQASVPVLLARAWGYVPSYWKDPRLISAISRFQDLGRTVRFYAYSLAADKKNAPEALRVLQSLRRAGLQIMGDPWPASDVVDEKNQWQILWFITGWTMTSIANGSLLDIMKTQKDTDAFATFSRETEAWEAQVNEKLALLDTEPSPYAVYGRD